MYTMLDGPNGMYTITENDALIAVDVQNDFCPGGALEVSEGDRVVPVSNSLVPRFGRCVFTRDWHPADHCSFSDAPTFVDKSWPVHCVAQTPGAAYHSGLRVPGDAIEIFKGTDRDREAYSGFEGTDLADRLRETAIARVFVCGLATDYCVKQTALDAKREGFEVVVLADACRAVDVPPGSGQAALAELQASGIVVASSAEVQS